MKELPPDPAWMVIGGALLVYFILAALFALVSCSPTKGPRRKKMAILAYGSLVLSIASVTLNVPLLVLGGFALGAYLRTVI